MQHLLAAVVVVEATQTVLVVMEVFQAVEVVVRILLVTTEEVAAK